MRPTTSSLADPGGDPSTGAASARADGSLPDPPEASTGGAPGAPRQPKLFRSVWRWHFYAGLLSIPVIVILCLSGIVYLFKPQIDAVAYGSMRNVDVGAHRLAYATQSGAVAKAYPGATITGLAPAPNEKRATEFDISTPAGRDLRVYVDPYTGRITGDREPSKSFTTLALDLHGTLLTSRFLDEAGTFGDRVIELTASWAVVLVITGMYLWWPRGKRGFRDAIRPRLRSKSSRTRWRDLHAVTGVLFGFVTLFFLLTGLAWTGVWGTKFAEVAAKTGQHYPAGLYDGAESTVADTVKNGKAAWSAGDLPLAGSQFPEQGSGSASGPVSSGGSGAGHTHQGDTANHGNHAAAGANGAAPGAGSGSGADGATAGQPALTEMAPGKGATATEPVGTLSAADVRAITAGRPDIEVKAGGDGHVSHSHPDSLIWDPSKGAPLDAVVGRAQQMGFPAGFTIAYPADEAGSYTLTKFPDADVDPSATAGSERIAYVDQYTALPIKDYGFDGFGVIGKATDFGIALHEGRQWGIWSQLFSLFGTLALLLSCATAIVMWRKRKPKGLGSPRRPPNRKLGAGVVVITLGLGLLFPLLGLSIVALLVFDFVIVRHVPPLRRALGAGR